MKAPWLFYCCAVVAPDLLCGRSVNALLLGGSSAVAGWSVVTLWSLSGCSGVFLESLGSVIVVVVARGLLCVLRLLQDFSEVFWSLV